MELPPGCVNLKVNHVTGSGFLWAFEFLNYSDATKEKRKLHLIEKGLMIDSKKPFENNNFTEGQFVKVFMPTWKRFLRGYITAVIQDKKSLVYQTFLIDYGESVSTNVRDLRKLPDFASVQKLPAQSWRLGIYGVLPLHVQLEFGEPSNRKIGKSWNGKDFQFIEHALQKNDTIDFKEIRKIDNYRYGIIYLKDPDTNELTTLQKLLVNSEYAVEVDDFDKVLPSIVRRLQKSPDHLSFPTGENVQEDKPAKVTDSPSDNESAISIDDWDTASDGKPTLNYVSPVTKSQPSSSIPTNTVSIDRDITDGKPLSRTAPMIKSQSSPEPPKRGKGRAEMLKSLSVLHKPPASAPAVMVGRLPYPDTSQFDNSPPHDTSPPKPEQIRRKSVAERQSTTRSNQYDYARCAKITPEVETQPAAQKPQRDWYDDGSSWASQPASPKRESSRRTHVTFGGSREITFKESDNPRTPATPQMNLEASRSRVVTLGRFQEIQSIGFDNVPPPVSPSTAAPPKSRSNPMAAAKALLEKQDDFSNPPKSRMISSPSPQPSRRESSSSIEIITPVRNSPTVMDTISLLTPPENSPILSRKLSNRLTSPETISLISPPSNPETISLITPPSGNVSVENTTEVPTETPRRGRSRGELLASLLQSSQSTNEKKGRGRGKLSALMKDIVPLEPIVSPPSRHDSISSAESIKPVASEFAESAVSVPQNHKDSVPENSPKTNDVPKRTPPCDGMFLTQAEFEEKLVNKIMVLGKEGNCDFKPGFSFDDFNIHRDVKLRISHLRIIDMTQCQRYMIPAVLTRRNVTLIDAPNSGKTVSCVIALLSLLREKDFYKALPVGAGPRAIILCPYSSRCEYIYKQCSEIAKIKSDDLDKPAMRINVAYGCGREMEREKLDELTKGYDVVICTPSCLQRMMETPELFNFKRLCHLVLDEAHDLFSSYTDDVLDILKKAYSVGKICQNGLILPQRIIISNQWLPSIKTTVIEDVTKEKGVLLMSSYYEAAIFSNIRVKLRHIDGEEKKRNDLLNYLNNDASNKSVVIVFNEAEELDETFEWLKSNVTRMLKGIAHFRSVTDDMVADWKRAANKGTNPILLCTDDTLHDLFIHEADSLVHYNLPEIKTGFASRFSTLLYRLTAPQEFYEQGKAPVKESKSETLIYIGRHNCDQFPKIVSLMERLRVTIPEELKNIVRELNEAREMKKDSNEFCENYKKFGSCANEEKCDFRHYFNPKYDQPADDVPKQGLVKVQILQVYSASHYSVRLLEHSAGSNKWDEIKSIMHPGVLNAKINNYYRNRNNRSMHICENIGEVASIETTSDIFKRVKILDFQRNEKTNELMTVKVKFMDDGKIADVRPSVLVKLPEEFATIPATTVDLFLCNILPVDRDIEWGDIISGTVREKVKELQDCDDIIFMGEIQLVSGRNIWVEPLQCQRIYEDYGDEVTIISSMSKDLIRKKIAVKNNEHLPKLLSMFESAGLVVPSLEDDPSTSPHCSIDSSVVQQPIAEDTPKEPRVDDKPVNETCEKESTSGTSDDVKDDENHESEEEWSLEEDAVSTNVPVQNNATSRNANEPDLSDEEDESCAHDYESDSMFRQGLDDDQFDCYFRPQELEALAKVLYPHLFDEKKPSSSNVEKKPSTVKAIAESSSVKKDETKPRIEEIKALPNASFSVEEIIQKGILKPVVEWHQDTEYIYLNIFLNVDKYTARFTTNSVYFRANTDNKTYEFDETLYTTINENNSRHYKSSVIVIFKLEKLMKVNKWSRVFKDKEVKKWIKKSKTHLDDDINIPDMCWSTKLTKELALIEPKIPKDFTYTSKTDSIYPEGYIVTEYLSEADSDVESGNEGYD